MLACRLGLLRYSSAAKRQCPTGMREVDHLLKQKVIYLEGIRGAAAFIVVLSHFFQVFLPSVFEGNADIMHFAFEAPAAKTPINLLFNGNFSVTLFFILSGYVLSYRFFRDKESSIIYSSAARRYLRLAIPAFVSVIFAFALMRFGFGYFNSIKPITQSSMRDPFAADPGIWAMLKEGLFHTFFTYGSQYNPVLWTMTYELFGSFLIFGFLLLMGKHWIRYIAYPILIYFFLDSYYLGFVLGLLLSDLHNSGRNWLELINRPWVNLLLVVAGIYVGSYPYIAPDDTVYSILVWNASEFSFFVFYHVVGSFFILLAALNSKWMQALFSSKPFAYLGKISFSMYLVHFTIICSFGSYLFMRLSHTLSYGADLAIVMLVTLIVIFGVSHLMYRYIDDTTVKLLSRWSNRLFKRKPRSRPVEEGNEFRNLAQ